MQECLMWYICLCNALQAEAEKQSTDISSLDQQSAASKRWSYSALSVFSCSAGIWLCQFEEDKTNKERSAFEKAPRAYEYDEGPYPRPLLIDGDPRFIVSTTTYDKGKKGKFDESDLMDFPSDEYYICSPAPNHFKRLRKIDWKKTSRR